VLEGANLLPRSVFQDLEILLREIGNRPSLSIEHTHIDRNERNAASKGTWNLRLLGSRGCHQQCEPGS
jgi:hypothetical protein